MKNAWGVSPNPGMRIMFPAVTTTKPAPAERCAPLTVQADDDMAQGAVVHVESTRPGNVVDVDVQGIAVVQVGVDH